MNPNSDKNRKLMKQYPFIEKILKRNMAPFGAHDDVYERMTLNPSGLPKDDYFEGTIHREIDEQKAHLDDLTIKVEVADGELLFRRPRNTGVSIDTIMGREEDHSWTFAFEGKHKSHVGRVGEHLFIVYKSGDIKRHCWRDIHSKPHDLATYPRYAFWTRTGHTWYTKPKWDEVEYLVWVTVQAWYNENPSDGESSRFGDLVERSAHVTIYREPKQGFQKLDDDSSETDFLRLDMRTLTTAYANDDRNLLIVSGRVDELCQLFMDDVWNNGLLDAFNGIDGRGMSGKLGDADVRVYYIAGRNVVTLEDQISQITFKGDSSDNYLGTHSMDGTLPQLRNLVKTVVRQWDEGPAKRELIRPDENVGIL